MYIQWDDVQLFLAIAETGSLTGAAAKLGITQPTASRRLAALESRVGDLLFERDSTGAKPTGFGERLLEPARRMAEWAGEVDRIAESGDTSPRGVVRITAPPGLAFDFLAPFAAELRRDLPDIRLEILATVEPLDLARREADLALRVHRPPDRELLSLASLEYGVGVFAAKAYIARLPKRPCLSDIDWVGWPPSHDHLPPQPQLRALIAGYRPVFTSDDFLVQLRAAEAGAGAIVLGRTKHRFSKPTSLRELRIDLGPKIRSTTHLICAKSALGIPRIRTVAERLTRELEQIACSLA